MPPVTHMPGPTSTAERRGKLRHLGTRGIGEGAVRIRRKAHDGNLQQVRACEVRDELRHGERHVAGAGTRGGLGGHDRSAREASRTANHEDTATCVLIHHARGRLENVNVIRRLTAPGHGIRLVHELGRLLCERSHHNGAADGLQGEHRDRDVGDYHRARGTAGLRGQATRHVNGDHAGSGGIQRVNPDGERGDGSVMKAGAEHGVEHNVSRTEQLVELVSGGTHQILHARLDGGAGHHGGEVAVEVLRLTRRHHTDVNA